MTTTNEPRALTTALQSPAFVTRGGGAALHAANRHVERWAPEAEAHRSRPLRNLGFVDRLVSPWIESAQRSASIRMFSQYMTSPVGERPASNVSWVFPRPWYQDELDWMTAAREMRVQTAVEPTSAPSMYTTRGTYVAPTQQRMLALPSTLHEYIAPSLSVARPDAPVASADAYSPLVPFAAAQAAHVMANAVAPIISTPAARMSVGLRSVLTTLLARSANAAPSFGEVSTRSSERAPELVTPPAPRPDTHEVSSASSIAEQYAEQRARIVELQRVARIAAEREAARVQAPAASMQAARQAEIRRRETEHARETERTRAEERTAQIVQIQQRARQQQEAARMHDAARDAAARDARTLPTPSVETRALEAAAVVEQRPISAEIAAAVAALPPELATLVASGIGRQPERAAQAIGELGEALRAIELMARTSAAGGTFDSARGPRVVMPAGLGGLVATVERTSAPQAAMPRMPMVSAPTAIAASAPDARMAAPAARSQLRMPALAFLAAPTSATAAPAPTSAIGAATANPPAALGHVAWSDRWLARFAGARPQSLDTLAAASGSPESRFQMLAQSAPSVFVAPAAPEPTASAARPAAPVRSDEVVRYDDNAETPDDVLFAISAAASRSRRAAVPPAGQPAAPKVVEAPAHPETPRETLADLVAHSAPTAPGAGLSAQLASSPFAVALRHILPLGVAPSFDVRALFGSELGASYLAGLISTSPDAITLSAPTLPTWASWGEPAIGAADTIARDVADFQPTYVAPDAGPVAGSLGDESAQTITTLRSSLLSFDVESAQASPTVLATPASFSSTGIAAPITGSAPLARTLVDQLARPMLGDAAALQQPGSFELDGDRVAQAAYTAPGMLAERAQAWSVAQERSTADLAFDFVSPELVLAARVYGLGPVEAAQAARLAIAGPGQLSAMASAVDRTFVQAMAIEAQRRGDRASITTAYPAAVNEAGAPAATSPANEMSSMSGTGAAFIPSTSSFGVERRTPRGAFLWPQAASAALGMNAAAPDGEQSMSVAALELLAAQAVAELGTFTALGPFSDADRSALASVAARGDGTAMAPVSTGTAPGTAAPRDEDVIESAMAFVPVSRRDKFQALYLALSSSPSGRTASPAARAARALALAGTGDEAVSARERASIAWDVLPVVYGIADSGLSSAESSAQRTPLSTGDAALELTRRREALRAIDPTYVEDRGHGLAARAGEALGSYVTPSAAPSGPATSTREREVGAVLRAPTAAPELVQTGRPAGQFGGGEVELPAWFEKAARKMLEERGGVSESISLAELTLVTSAPAPQIAASSRGTQGAATAQTSPAAAATGGEKQQVDIEKLANEVYREILILMDTARVRNGEPYL